MTKTEQLSGWDVVLLEGELQRPVPTGVYPPRHLLLVSPVLASDLRRLGVTRLVCQAFQKLVGGYLHMLCGVAVSCVLAGLVTPGHVPHALKERGPHRLGLLACGGSPTHGVQSLAQAPLVLLGLTFVVLQHLLDLGIVGGGDHGVDHLEVVLLHGVRVLDVIGQLRLELVIGHVRFLLVLLWADWRLGVDPVVFISNRSKKGRNPKRARPPSYSCSPWKRGTSISLARWAARRLFSRIPLKNSTSSWSPSA